MNKKTIRWQQRYNNLDKAFKQLERNISIEVPNDTEKQGIIQSFEFTFELSWKTLKDYLESEGIMAATPREVLKQAFHVGFIKDGDAWIDMLEQRNLMSHTYDEKNAELALSLIKNNYFKNIQELMIFFKKKYL